MEWDDCYYEWVDQKLWDALLAGKAPIYTQFRGAPRTNTAKTIDRGILLVTDHGCAKYLGDKVVWA